MNRQDREHGHDYGRYEGYNREDNHYHSARNLTDEFEQEFQSHSGHRDDKRYRMDHTYHEGDMGDTYERLRREGRGYGNYADYQRNDRNRNRNHSGSFSRDRDSYRNYNDFVGDQDRYREDRDRSREYGNSQQRYGTSGGYASNDRDDYRRREDRRDDHFGEGDYDSTSRYGSRDYNSGTGYTGGYSTGNRYDSDHNGTTDDRSIPGRRSYLQNRYY